MQNNQNNQNTVKESKRMQNNPNECRQDNRMQKNATKCKRPQKNAETRKIMQTNATEYIRRQKNAKHVDPACRHIIYGSIAKRVNTVTQHVPVYSNEHQSVDPISRNM